MNEDERTAAGIPKPPAMNFPLPTPPREGWWEDPSVSDILQLRYHDGKDWTDFVCQVGFRSKGPIIRNPMGDSSSEIKRPVDEPTPLQPLSRPLFVATLVGLALVAAGWSFALLNTTAGAALYGKPGVVIVRGHCDKYRDQCRTTLLEGNEERRIHLELAGVELYGERAFRVRHRNGHAVLDTLAQRGSVATMVLVAALISAAFFAGAAAALLRKGRRVVWALALAVPVVFIISILLAWSSAVQRLPQEEKQELSGVKGLPDPLRLPGLCPYETAQTAVLADSSDGRLAGVTGPTTCAATLMASGSRCVQVHCRVQPPPIQCTDARGGSSVVGFRSCSSGRGVDRPRPKMRTR